MESIEFGAWGTLVPCVRPDAEEKYHGEARMAPCAHAVARQAAGCDPSSVGELL